MKNKLKVGIIGTGKMANVAHCPSLAGIEDPRIITACDTDRKNQKESQIGLISLILTDTTKNLFRS